MSRTLETYKVYGRSLLLGALAGIGLALVFTAGFVVRDVVDMPSVFASSGNSTGSDDGYPLLNEVENLLENHYLWELPSQTVRQYSAIRGLLSGLEDHNTFFIEPPVARSESDVLAGTYGGIGVTLQRNADGDFVLYPFPDSPAMSAGIVDGDVLIAVSNTILDTTMSLDAVDQMLRGEVKEGNGVDITIKRDTEEMSRFIPFEVINVPSVLWRVLAEDNRLGYIQLLRFTSRTPEEVKDAVAELKVAGVEGLVLDIRNNSGGLLQESIEVASVFLEDSVVLYQRTRDGERVFETVDDGGQATGIPLVVLVNRGTASASELVAGAIQDHERGVLIGQTTFGKGTIQQIFSLSDTSSVHITSAEWLTPDRNALDGVGLQPDIMMIPDESGRDIEIGEAVRYLQEEISVQEQS